MENKITKIQVLGTGCPTCKQLFEAVKKIATELKIETEVEYITDVTETIKMGGVMTSPVLVVNNNPVLTGRGHSDEEIRKALENNPPKEKDRSGCCSCCCNC